MGKYQKVSLGVDVEAFRYNLLLIDLILNGLFNVIFMITVVSI